MHVVATAGHVDHGKSTLVRALTGTEPDRLAEEQRRGLSIELGYCWTDLGEAGEVAFVDVPGHERFLATTLAGIGPVPAVMLVVAADDPWMPQAAEHLAALDALGVRDGVLVVTRSDLADPAPALARARAEVERTSLAGIPAVTVSGRTGAGLDGLRDALTTSLLGLPVPHPDADVRLWLDRRFHVRGAGTVVTGTLGAGTLRRGDLLEFGEAIVRVRGVESLGRPVEAVSGVARVALDLGGRVPDGLRRDSVLVSRDAFERVRVFDASLSSGDPLPERPLLHIGATAMSVHVRPLGPAHVRVVLPVPLPLRYGDRAILRDPGSRALWGIRVLDPAPPLLRRRGSAAARPARLASLDGTARSVLADRPLWERSALRRLGIDDRELPPGTVQAEGWLLSAARARELSSRLEDAVARSGAGLSTGAAVRLLGLPEPALLGPLVRPPLRLQQGAVVTERSLAPGLAGALAALERHLAEDHFAAPDAGQLAELGLDPATIARLARDGLVTHLGGSVVLLPDATEQAAQLLATLPQPFSVSEARTRLGTSRRVALPLLAHLDRTGVTVRLADDRRRLRRPQAQES